MIAIFGPTGVGKTEVAVALAELLRSRGESPVAVSADAIQVYRGLDVLTGKAGIEDQRRLEHRLISYVPINEPYNAYLFARAAHREVDCLLAAGRRPIVVGGTGLYVRAALAEMDMRPARSEEESQLWSEETRHPAKIFGLVMDRQGLYRRIKHRVERMIAAGVRREVEEAVRAGASRTARQAIGFEELAAGLPDAEVARSMEKATRNYAKRQLTWLRRVPGLQTIDRTGLESGEVAARIAAFLDSEGAPAVFGARDITRPSGR